MKKVRFSVNSRPIEVVADEKDGVLLDVVREDLGLIGTKQSCDRKGQCGTCMVLVDGKAVLSCITKTAALDGTAVTTSEGLGTPDNPNLLQQAFVLAGAVQCGFCIPGMIVTAEELLAANPDPTRDEVKRALRRNLCRCTGYVKIIDAVQLAGRFMRGEIAPADLMPKADAPNTSPCKLARVRSLAAICITGSAPLSIANLLHAHEVIRGVADALSVKLIAVTYGFTRLMFSTSFFTEVLRGGVISHAMTNSPDFSAFSSRETGSAGVGA